jgi:MoaA/NifB/PqqE/SkfB family radical SAM enzyme
MSNLTKRAAKHLRLQWKNLSLPEAPSPPFVILFINSICNMKCEHCFYWQQLNSPDDLTFDELVGLSNQLGPIENLNLSGGEPFLRKDFGKVCRQFIDHNGVKEIYVPTNGFYTDKTVTQIRDTLQNKRLELFGVELSLDGMPEFHDKFRVTKDSFKKAMETYDALEALAAEDDRLQIHAISTATATNMDQIRMLTTFLYDRCPKMSHHNLAIIRGDRKDPSLEGPQLAAYQDLAEYVHRLWAPREQGRAGSVVEPMLQWAKVKTAQEKRQVVPCRAGVLSAVIYHNGDVSMCETHKPIGSIRKNTFREIWHSEAANRLRASIKAKECYCTNEIFLWPSITFQPVQLLRALTSAKVWKKPEPIQPEERAEWRGHTADVPLPVLSPPQ